MLYEIKPRKRDIGPIRMAMILGGGGRPYTESRAPKIRKQAVAQPTSESTNHGWRIQDIGNSEAQNTLIAITQANTPQGSRKLFGSVEAEGRPKPNDAAPIPKAKRP